MSKRKVLVFQAEPDVWRMLTRATSGRPRGTQSWLCNAALRGHLRKQGHARKKEAA